MKRKSSAEGSTSSSKTPGKPSQQVFLEKYKEEPGIVESSAGKTFAHCLYCRVDLSIAHSGKFDIDKHCRTKQHKNRVETRKAAATCQSIQSFMPSKNLSSDEQSTIKAEAMFAELIAKTNLPLTTADIISRTVKSAFPDSAIAQKFQCGRSKTTALIKCMASDEKQSLKERMRSGPFSVSTDGSNESREKQYPVVITTIGQAGVTSELLSVPTLDLQSPSTGENIFKLVEKELKSPSTPDADKGSSASTEDTVPWHNCLSLGSDNAPVMTGRKNGVYGRMLEKQPALHLAGCPCHLIHRAAERGSKELPVNIGEILVDLYYYLESSSKRLAALKSFQEEVKHHKILKHVATRWLSVGRCLERLIENWDALRKFFKNDSSSTCSSSSQSRQVRLQTFFRSHTNKLYCMFLKNALLPFDVLNQQLQTDQPQIHVLRRCLHKLLRDLLTKFVKPAVLVGEKDVMDIDFSKPENLREKVVLGTEITALLAKKEELHLREERVKEFFMKTRSFYSAACNYIKEKFPMKEELLAKAEVADVSLRLKVTEDHLQYFANRFPCLVPEGSTIQVKDAVGVPMFQQLSSVMLGILCIPHSNAGCERIFSCVRKNRTDQRASLSAETMDSLMVRC